MTKINKADAGAQNADAAAKADVKADKFDKTLKGTAGADLQKGTAGNDKIVGKGGDDKQAGGNGHDLNNGGGNNGGGWNNGGWNNGGWNNGGGNNGGGWNNGGWNNGGWNNGGGNNGGGWNNGGWNNGGWNNGGGNNGGGWNNGGWNNGGWNNGGGNNGGGWNNGGWNNGGWNNGGGNWGGGKPKPMDPIKVENGRIWGDPHFVGADGGKYDVQGQAGKTYNLLSDRGVQVNGRFDQWGANNSGMTVVGAMGITAGGNQITFDKTGKLSINGQVQNGKGEFLNGDVKWNGKDLTVKAGEYTIQAWAKGGGNNRYLDINFRSENAVADNVKPSGLWGVTVDGDGKARNGDVGRGMQGGGAIENAKGEIVARGDKETVKEYEVGGLLDTNFRGFDNQFRAGGWNNGGGNNGGGWNNGGWNNGGWNNGGGNNGGGWNNGGWNNGGWNNGGGNNGGGWNNGGWNNGGWNNGGGNNGGGWNNGGWNNGGWNNGGGNNGGGWNNGGWNNGGWNNGGGNNGGGWNNGGWNNGGWNNGGGNNGGGWNNGGWNNGGWNNGGGNNGGGWNNGGWNNGGWNNGGGNNGGGWNNGGWNNGGWNNGGGNNGGGWNNGGWNNGGWNNGGWNNGGWNNGGGNNGGGWNNIPWANAGNTNTNWAVVNNNGTWQAVNNAGGNNGGNNAGWGVVNNNGTWQAVNGGGQQAQPQISAADQAVIDYVKGKEGKWLIGHGKYNHANGGYTFKEGPLKGYTAVHQGGGKYHINNGDGQKVADYNNGKGKDKVASPVALDLNGDGRISTTGVSTAQQRIDGQVGETIAFDIDGDGTKEQVEWITGGDGLVVDMTKIGANGEIDGNALMGDQGGRYTDGYQKMATYDQNGDGQLTGGEMANMGVWVDANGDGDVDAGELRSAAEAGVTQLSTQRNDVVNERGETLMQSSANNGQMLTEDVWFAQK
ncbi:pe-pgrs family protein [Roseibium sp. TrichSKD4]|uniref:hypothetical protein n=1 Tax=Roseibium sp. TrichSKD4 TaxID=744980 RepID=UPI0001E574A9|nr:hypothetical protein [Roseibium sp. TrichSKD4]EFO30816.1 pe-pgrs family protein [Roseibium sp. TrichSKD4]